MYVIRVGIYFSFIFLVDGVQTSIAGYGMMFSLEQYHQIERWLIQYPMLPFLLYFVYLVGLDSGIRYGYTKLSSKCSFKPTAI
ncbi:MAG: hypothetical protein LBP53_03230 [Candidatus Peribacteria bacterium]|nr:hypothetical protein [Candidatus Peribacteria bacterium]